MERDFAQELWDFAVRLTREHARQLREEKKRAIEDGDFDHKTHGGLGDGPGPACVDEED